VRTLETAGWSAPDLRSSPFFLSQGGPLVCPFFFFQKVNNAFVFYSQDSGSADLVCSETLTTIIVPAVLYAKL